MGKKKYNKAINKIVGIIFKLVLDQYQLIIKGKTPQEAWIDLQKRFEHINPMSTSQIIYNAIIKKLLDFKNIHKYISHYQTSFDKVVNFLIRTSFYTCTSTKCISKLLC